ncbi:hypothetical protein AB0K43_30635 [Kitasatospora sp. NPDC049258]|uniref:hypothetical protein n=1 Tax=Kitasatospora sp. NPDC049258 TaxID=3155394 RepID=UPI00343AC831
MTTAGSNGTPESAGDDDPFAYLYRPAEGETAAQPQPRNSYSRPMEVGRAQYGAHAPAAAPTQQFPAGPQAAQAASVPQQARYAERSRPQPGEERPSGGRGKAAVIGAVAVIAAVAVGAGIALSTGDPDGKPETKASQSGVPVASTQPSSASSPPAPASPTADGQPIADAAKLQGQNAPTGNTVKGAISADGGYLTMQAGSSATWTVSVPSAGQYKLWLHFNNSVADLPASVSVNGADHPGGVTFKNYGKGSADPERSWFSTNIWPQLQAGTNTVTVTIPAGGSGSILLDQVALTPMSVTDYPKR